MTRDLSLMSSDATGIATFSVFVTPLNSLNSTGLPFACVPFVDSAFTVELPVFSAYSAPLSTEITSEATLVMLKAAAYLSGEAVPVRCAASENTLSMSDDVPRMSSSGASALT